MRAQIDSAHIQEAIKIIQRLAPPTSGNVNIQLKDKKLMLRTQSDTAQCDLIIPGTVKGDDAFFAVPLETLRDATKGRNEIDMAFDKQMLNVSSGKYKVSMATVDAVLLEGEEQQQEEEKKDSKEAKWKVPQEHAQWLKEAVAQVSLKDTPLTQTFMPLSVRLTNKKAFVACHDTHRMSFVTSKDVTGDIEFTLPLATISAVLDIFHVAPFTMTMTKSMLKVKNKVAEVRLSLPYSEDTEHFSIDEVMSIAKHTAATDGSLIEIDRDDTIKFIDSAKAISSKERSELHCEVEKGQVTFKVRTANGSAREQFKAATKKKGQFKIDLEYFDEAVRKSKSLSFKLVTDEFVMFNTSASASLVVSLNQESGE